MGAGQTTEKTEPEITEPETTEQQQAHPHLSEEQWKKKLTRDEYNVLRLKRTERRNVGFTNKYPKTGYFACKGCMNPLYSFTAKFDSGCVEFSCVNVALLRGA